MQPQWIERVFPGKAGRDHLGLGSVSSNQILTSLSPAINVLTFHPRYHSFYTFLLDEYWSRDLPRTKNDWVEFFRPRDFIYSVAAHLCDMPEHSGMGNIVGAQKTQGLAQRRLELYSYDKEYIKSELGGYGLYYQTVMAELGIIYPGGRDYPVPVDVPSEFGKQVAQSFRDAIKKTTYYRDYFDKPHTNIPIGVIEEYIRKACLCQLRKDTAPDRAHMLDAFLYRQNPEQAEPRRETFRFFLDMAKQTSNISINEETFRTLIFYRETESGSKFSPSRDVQLTAMMWRMYQAREYYAYALNGLWKALTDWGVAQGGVYRPLSLQLFWNFLENNSLNFDTLSQEMEISLPGLDAHSRIKDIIAWIEKVVDAQGDDFDNKCNLNAPINEHKLYKSSSKNDPAELITKMIIMLVIVYLRFRSPDWRKKPEWEISRKGDEQRLSLDRFITSVDHLLENTHITTMEVVRWLFENYIIFQHELVAASKLPENTFRFEREGDHLIFYHLNTDIDFNSSRFDAISTTLSDLGLTGNFYQPEHRPTDDGLKLLEKGSL